MRLHSLDTKDIHLHRLNIRLTHARRMNNNTTRLRHTTLRQSMCTIHMDLQYMAGRNMGLFREASKMMSIRRKRARKSILASGGLLYHQESHHHLLGEILNAPVSQRDSLPPTPPNLRLERHPQDNHREGLREAKALPGPAQIHQVMSIG